MQGRDFDLPVLDAVGSRGICTTCVHRPSCQWAAHASKPIWSCDEFEVMAGPTVARVAVAEPATREEVAPGLCGNCENAGSCTLPGRHGGGVWYCEEYR